MVPYRRPYTRREYLAAALVVVGAFVAGVMYDASIAETKQAKMEGLRARDSEKLQHQIDEMRTTLKRLTAENENLISQQGDASSKHASELKACEERLRISKGEAARYATREKELQSTQNQLEDMQDDLEAEKKKAFEMEIKAKTVSDKLESTKTTLDEIQRQKEESNKRYELELAAQSKEGRNMVAASVSKATQGMAPFISHIASLPGVGGALANAAKQKLKKKEAEGGGGNVGKEMALGQVQKLIEKMNSDIVSKQTRIAELTEKKKESDTLVRKMENKLLEAGVEPEELEKFSRKSTDAFKKLGNNPALAAASQVVGGARDHQGKNIASAKAQITFGKVDDNGDDTIDFLEFQKATHTLGGGDMHSRSYKLSKHKFDQLDTDRSGYITMDEVMSKGAQKFNQIFQEAEDAGAAGESAAAHLEHSVAHNQVSEKAKEKTMKDTKKGGGGGRGKHDGAMARIMDKRGTGHSKHEEEEEEEEDNNGDEEGEGQDEEMPIQDEDEEEGR